MEPLISKESVKEQNMLKAAMTDLEEELRKLRVSRGRLENKVNKVSQQLSLAQSQEIELRDRISQLMRTETDLENKKTKIKDKMAVLSKKIEKVRSIGRELKEV